MEAKIEEISSVKKKIQFVVPADTVQAKMEAAYVDLRRKVQIKGFRKGKAPLDLIRSQYKGDVESRVNSDLISATLADLIEEKKIEPVAYPVLEDKKVVEGGALEVRVSVEVRPDIEARGYQGVVLERQVEEPTDKDVDDVLERIAKQQATLKDKEAKAGDKPAENDWVVFSSQLTVDGENLKEGAIEDHTAQLNGGQLLPELEEALKTMAVGEEREVTVPFPQDHSNKQLAGKPALFHLRLQGLKEQQLPAIDDAFAKSLGDVETLKELRGKIHQELLDERGRLEENRLRREAIQQVLSANPFEVPPSLVDRRFEYLMRQWLQSGMHAHGDDEAKALEKRGREAALNEVRTDLLLEAIAKREGVEVSEDELRAEVDRIVTHEAARSGGKVSEDELRKFFAREEQQQSVRDQLQSGKTVDFIMGAATIRDKSKLITK